jgi:hypothetical protein
VIRLDIRYMCRFGVRIREPRQKTPFTRFDEGQRTYAFCVRLGEQCANQEAERAFGMLQGLAKLSGSPPGANVGEVRRDTGSMATEK